MRIRDLHNVCNNIYLKKAFLTRSPLSRVDLAPHSKYDSFRHCDHINMNNSADVERLLAVRPADMFYPLRDCGLIRCDICVERYLLGTTRSRGGCNTHVYIQAAICIGSQTLCVKQQRL